jgi:hypothetical protein
MQYIHQLSYPDTNDTTCLQQQATLPHMHANSNKFQRMPQCTHLLIHAASILWSQWRIASAADPTCMTVQQPLVLA